VKFDVKQQLNSYEAQGLLQGLLLTVVSGSSNSQLVQSGRVVF
jgi:hypothetical protein